MLWVIVFFSPSIRIWFENNFRSAFGDTHKTLRGFVKCCHSFALGIKGKFVFQMSFFLLCIHIYGQGIGVLPQRFLHGIDAVAAQAEICK